VTRIHLMAAAACAALLAGSALAAKVDLSSAPRANVATLMHERHEGMEKVGKLTKQLARAVKADPLDARTARANAEAMDALAQRSATWFRAGTGPESGKTDARAEIWQKPQDFSIKMTQWQVAARNLRTAARSADPAATRAAFSELGKTCKSCHTTYRKDS
jgi:cytochrome c556